MTETAEIIAAREKARRNREIAKIHLAKKQCGLDDMAYRAMLKRVAGCSSSAELTADGRALALDELKRLGFKPAPPKAAGRRIPETNEPQIRLIRALWLDLRDMGVLRDPSEKALAHYCQKICGISAINWLGPLDARKFIGALVRWKSQVEQKKAAGQ